MMRTRKRKVRKTERDRRPFYARLLRLKHVRPGHVTCFVLFEGSIALAFLLGFAELVSVWTALALPVLVALMVKLNDVIAGAVAVPGEEGSYEDPLVRQWESEADAYEADYAADPGDEFGDEHVRDEIDEEQDEAESEEPAEVVARAPEDRPDAVEPGSSADDAGEGSADEHDDEVDSDGAVTDVPEKQQPVEVEPEGDEPVEAEPEGDEPAEVEPVEDEPDDDVDTDAAAGQPAHRDAQKGAGPSAGAADQGTETTKS